MAAYNIQCSLFGPKRDRQFKYENNRAETQNYDNPQDFLKLVLIVRWSYLQYTAGKWSLL